MGFMEILTLHAGILLVVVGYTAAIVGYGHQPSYQTYDKRVVNSYGHGNSYGHSSGGYGGSSGGYGESAGGYGGGYGREGRAHSKPVGHTKPVGHSYNQQGGYGFYDTNKAATKNTGSSYNANTNQVSRYSPQPSSYSGYGLNKGSYNSQNNNYKPAATTYNSNNNYKQATSYNSNNNYNTGVTASNYNSKPATSYNTNSYNSKPSTSYNYNKPSTTYNAASTYPMAKSYNLAAPTYGSTGVSASYSAPSSTSYNGYSAPSASSGYSANNYNTAQPKEQEYEAPHYVATMARSKGNVGGQSPTRNSGGKSLGHGGHGGHGYSYDPCSKLPEGDYVLEGHFQGLFPYADPQCNFIKCSNYKAYVNPCAIGTKNDSYGKGFCYYHDKGHYCGYPTKHYH